MPPSLYTLEASRGFSCPTLEMLFNFLLIVFTANVKLNGAALRRPSRVEHGGFKCLVMCADISKVNIGLSV